MLNNQNVNSQELLSSIVFDVKSKVGKYPHLGLWWFGSSITKVIDETNDIDFAIITSLEKTKQKLTQELKDKYPTCHIDRVQIYTKSTNKNKSGEVGPHFVIGGFKDLVLNKRLFNGVRRGICLVKD